MTEFVWLIVVTAVALRLRLFSRPDRVVITDIVIPPPSTLRRPEAALCRLWDMPMCSSCSRLCGHLP